MIFGQLASVGRLSVKFDAGTTKSLQDFRPPLLEKSIEFVLITLSSQVLFHSHETEFVWIVKQVFRIRLKPEE